MICWSCIGRTLKINYVVTFVIFFTSWRKVTSVYIFSSCYEYTTFTDRIGYLWRIRTYVRKQTSYGVDTTWCIGIGVGSIGTTKIIPFYFVISLCNRRSWEKCISSVIGTKGTGIYPGKISTGRKWSWRTVGIARIWQYIISTIWSTLSIFTCSTCWPNKIGILTFTRKYIPVCTIRSYLSIFTSCTSWPDQVSILTFIWKYISVCTRWSLFTIFTKNTCRP